MIFFSEFHLQLINKRQMTHRHWDMDCKIYIGGLRDDANRYDIGKRHRCRLWFWKQNQLFIRRGRRILLIPPADIRGMGSPAVPRLISLLLLSACFGMASGIFLTLEV